MSSITLRFLAEPSTVNFGGKVQAGTMEKTTECVIVLVALDEHGKPVPVNSWNPETPGEVALAANVRAQLTASRAHHH